MKKPELVVMAAGMGSRYGGLKQIDPIDEYGHIIIDYSIYDAMRAGFKSVTFIIKKEIEADFRAVMDKHLEGKDIEIKYVFQEIDKIPQEFKVPVGRKKPWGTAHAIACCKGVVNAPFAVINADDYYGENAFKKIYAFLADTACDSESYAMVGYRVKNTVTDNGTVSRGVCMADDKGMLVDIVERTKVGISDNGIYYTEDGVDHPLDADALVSMNLWGFKPSYIDECLEGFEEFLKDNLDKNPEKCEFYLPTVVSRLMSEGKVSVKVLDNDDKWYGVTYKEDKADVEKAFAALLSKGVYPKAF